ncbi:potassium transporter TrkG [Schaalia sp. ZJ1691]|uniref:TrkH family potassium uptake protein n=1 Tax=Schaalia sp. ZJ1691 TaxID=2709404 RepID=UPI0013E9CC96|nr:potassium transporter TrkG [Schaalia sp. ZJ1691]
MAAQRSRRRRRKHSISGLPTHQARPTSQWTPDEFSATPHPSPVIKTVHVHSPDALENIRTTHTHRFREWFTKQARYSPARLALAIFALINVAITALLCLPFASASSRSAPFVDVVFTAVSAVCVTGLTTVDTATYWSVFGQAVIALGIMIGGLGIMTLASILGIAVSRHLGLTQRLLAAQETKSDSLGQLSGLLKAVLVTSLTAEGILFLVFFPRFITLGEPIGKAAWEALFMAISVFNNAGFVILVGGLAPHASDWWMLLPIVLGTAIGAVGFPVMQDLAARWRTPQKWALHTKLTLSVYLILTVVGAVMLALTEWTNPETLGGLDDTPSKVLNALLAGVNSRSSGLSTLDVGVMKPQTHFVQDILMFIGGGSASTAGGIKVTTFAVLILAGVAEARGDQDIESYGRRIPPSVVRLAVAVTLIGVAMVCFAVVILLFLTNYSLDVILFESVSAFATVGLSTGITATLPAMAKYVLIALMFAGRTGSMTVAAALAIRERSRVIRMPEERPIIG